MEPSFNNFYSLVVQLVALIAPSLRVDGYSAIEVMHILLMEHDVDLVYI